MCKKKDDVSIRRRHDICTNAFLSYIYPSPGIPPTPSLGNKKYKKKKKKEKKRLINKREKPHLLRRTSVDLSNGRKAVGKVKLVLAGANHEP